MVRLRLESSKETTFLYETTNDTPLTEIIEEVASIHNAILRIRCLIGLAKDLIKSGPLGENQERHDPPSDASVLQRAIADAETAIAADQVKKNVCFTPAYVSEELARLSGAVTIVWPQGLPTSEPVRRVLEGGDVQGEQDPGTCQLWWARKSMQRGKLFRDYIGGNARQVIVAKVTDAKSGPPPKDMSFGQEGQLKLMSELHRKAEELKRISKDDDDSYLDQEWANPRGLANTFQGITSIDWKPQ
jgi:hypothetical protein